MKLIQTVFCWLGGVLVESLPEAVARTLYALPIEDLPIGTRQRLRELAEDVLLGRLDGDTFCRRAIEPSGIDITPEMLAGRIREAPGARPEVLDILREMQHLYEYWLIADYPPDWLGRVTGGSGLQAYFPPERVISTAECRLNRVVPDLFYYVVHRANRPMDVCMVIDGNSARAVQAVRHGLSSTIFVDGMRLRRDFGLRQVGVVRTV